MNMFLAATQHLLLQTHLSMCSMHVFILLPHEMEMEKRVKRFFATNRYKYLSYERNLTLSCNIFKKVLFAGIAKTIRVSTRSERSKRVLMSAAQPYYLIFIGPFVKKPCALEYDENWNTTHIFSLFRYPY